MTWVLLRKSVVSDDAPSMPRPKIVQKVLHIGSESELREILDEIRLNPENQSSDYINVELSVVKYIGQKSYNSKEVTKNNGKTRNTGGFAGNASGADH